MFKCFYLFALVNEYFCLEISRISVYLCVCAAWCVEIKQSQSRESRCPCAPEAEAFWSSFIFSPSLLVFCLHTCLSLHLGPDLGELYTEAHVSVGSFRRRAGPAGPTMEEIPQAHMELLSPVLTLTGILQLSVLRTEYPKLGG